MVRVKGEKKVVLFKSQNYHQIKKHCLHLLETTDKLFEDPAFPAIDAVLAPNLRLPDNILWKRPKEICPGAKLCADVEKCDGAIRGAELTSYWMLSACSILSNIGEIRNRIMPDYWEQECIGDEGKYCGLFHFRFWRFGRWVDVVVDDLLPTVDNKLITTHTENSNEFWTALMEKAYAKLHGSYEALREYNLTDILVDLTGGVTEVVELEGGHYSEDRQEARSQLLDTLMRETADHTILAMSVHASMPSDIGTRTELGICRGYVYQVTDIKKVYLAETNLRNLFKGREKVAMLRLKDPRIIGEVVPGSPLSCGSGERYAYSTATLSRLRSRNSDWQKVKDSERHRLGLLFSSAHEFWMPLEDVLGEFTEVMLCRLVNENVFTISGRRRWGVSAHLGRWEPTTGTSGGGDAQSQTFLNNPQYLFRAKSQMELMVQLIQFQSDNGCHSPSDHRINHLIGFHIIKVEENRETRLKRLWDHCAVVVHEEHKRRRQATYKGRLSRGTYLLVPSTQSVQDKAHFIVRLFTKQRHAAKLKEVTVDKPKKLAMLSCIACLADDIEWVTVIIINSIELPESQSSPSSSSRLSRLSGIYCRVVCEGNSQKTELAKDDQRPTWNTAYIFYRKAPHKPINIQLLKRNAVFADEVVCECELPAGVNHALTPLVAALRPRRTGRPPSSSGAPSQEELGGKRLCGGGGGGEPAAAALLRLTLLTEDNTLAI